MKFQTFVNSAFVLAASLLLAACGGGGPSLNPNQGGPISASPENGTFYAGEPATITVSGGRKPYAITSSEPGILPVPAIVNANSFEVIPNNPGVVDTGLAAGALPVRSIVVSVRDTTGILVNITIKVAQNFVTGYGLRFVSSTCPPPAVATASVSPCAGSDTAIELSATINGSLHGNEAFRLEVVRGQFSFYTPDSSTGIISNTVTVTSDHEGKIVSVIRVPRGVPTQVAIIRVVHIGTGASQEQVFTITGASSVPLTLTAIPSTITFTGADATACGTGSADFLVFDGVPPYSAVSVTPGVQVTPASPNTQPGRFTVTIGSGLTCANAAPIVVTDSLGNRVTVSVTSKLGAAGPAPVAMVVGTNTITIACGSQGSIAIAGGSGVYQAASTLPQVTPTVAGRILTISRALGPDPPGPFPATATVTVTDGATSLPITVSFLGLVGGNRCPP